MLDIATVTALASSAVAVLTPLLQKAAEKGAEELGKSSAGVLVDKLKQRLSHGSAKEALDDLVKLPDDAAAQGALKMQLRKALGIDPTLEEFLNQWVAESQSTTGISLSAHVVGDNNKTTQIAGSGNSVS